MRFACLRYQWKYVIVIDCFQISFSRFCALVGMILHLSLFCILHYPNSAFCRGILYEMCARWLMSIYKFRFVVVLFLCLHLRFRWLFASTFVLRVEIDLSVVFHFAMIFFWRLIARRFRFSIYLFLFCVCYAFC
jgi:hypothetical protein